MKIVFMGTPDFAVSSLELLAQTPYDLCAVYTQPDKPQGRKQILTPPPVKVFAITQGLKVFQPESLKDPAVIEQLAAMQPDLIVVVAYGKLLPKAVLDIPRYGCVNLHGSLLPKYRGAAPIQWSVLNGDETVGVSTMFMDEGLDTGDVLLRYETPLGENETAAELFDRLKTAGAQLLLETIRQIENGTATRTPQQDAEASYAPMLSKQMSPLDLTMPAAQVHNRIRGLSDWPTATIELDGKPLKIYRSALAPTHRGEAGVLLDDKRMLVGCGDGRAVEFLEVQPQGGKRMDAAAFLRGRKLKAGQRLQ